jgi:hypothetical protein
MPKVGAQNTSESGFEARKRALGHERNDALGALQAAVRQHSAELFPRGADTQEQFHGAQPVAMETGSVGALAARPSEVALA